MIWGKVWPNIMLCLCLLGGCRHYSTAGYSGLGRDYDMIEQVSYTDVQQPHAPPVGADAIAPPTVRDPNAQPWPMTVDEAIRIALDNSPVIRGAGGHVLEFPGAARTAFDPQMVDSDPRFGPQSALSEFDTRFSSRISQNGGGENYGSLLSSDSAGLFAEPASVARMGVNKTFDAGTQVGMGVLGGYDPSLQSATSDLPGFAGIGATIRQPLRQGFGREFNNIAGPNAQPGLYRGILIARIDSDKALVELEKSVRDLVRDVVAAYWELHLAHQHLNIKRAGLKYASESWQLEQQRVAAKVSPPDNAALAKQQYYAAQAAVHNALSGTQPNSIGVYAAELKLRGLLALPASDGRLIQPTTSPLTQEVGFDWAESLQTARTRRVELRRQHYELRKCDLELIAAKNFDRYRVDLVGTYRSPLGDASAQTQGTSFGDTLQSWQIGVEIGRPVGNRRGDTAVRNAELKLRREQAILQEQHRQVSNQLRAAFTELDRAFAVKQSHAAGREAAHAHLSAEIKRNEAGTADLDRVLEAQRRAVQTEAEYFQAEVEYNLAFVNVHLARGTLLDSLNVRFAENAVADRVPYTLAEPTIFAQRSTSDTVAGSTVAPPSFLPSKNPPQPHIATPVAREASPESRRANWPFRSIR